MKLNLSPAIKLPDIRLAEGVGNKKVLEQIMRMLYDAFSKIYKDLSNISVTRVAALPSASSDLVGKFYLRINAGAIDTLHVCVYDLSDTSYKFKAVTLT